MSWEGVELRLETPSTTDTTATATDTVVDEAPPPLQVGPVLFVARRSDDSVRLVPAAVLEREGLQSFPTDDETRDFVTRFRNERMSSGQRFVLFAAGMRAGTFYTEAAGEVDSTYCAPRPTVLGRVEILPEAAEVERFLALPVEAGERYSHSDFDRVTSGRPHRVASLNMAGSLFATMEIQWPPSVLESRADVQVFRPGGSEGEVVAATFLYGDSLAVGGAPNNAYSLFFLGEETDGGYAPTYVHYREVGPDGKEATRFVDHLDWNRDGRDEVLLEAYGTTNRWFLGLERTGGQWQETFREGCAGSDDGEAAIGRPGRAGDPDR